MFRGITNRLGSAFSSSEDIVDLGDTSTLTDMGFTLEESRNALLSTNGNISEAANLLLLSSTSETISSSAATPSNHSAPYRQRSCNDEDSDLQKALKESLDMQKQNKNKTKNNKNNNVKKEQLEKKKKTTRLPPRLKDKSQEEQISRCVSRLQSYPRAVDTLIIALSAIRDNPGNQKYRSIDTSSPGYKETLLNVPGVQDLLLCIRFQKQGQYLKLDRFHIDLALLWLAISTLQNATSSKEYIAAKDIINFHKTIKQMLDEKDSSSSSANNNNNKLSSEPDSTQNSSLIHIKFTESITNKRRFHPDDTLQDIITWIGILSSPIEYMITNNEWVLVDKSFSPPTPIPINTQMLRKTLQTLGWWPSGTLQILMKDMVVSNDNSTTQFSNERGLGVASSS